MLSPETLKSIIELLSQLITSRQTPHAECRIPPLPTPQDVEAWELDLKRLLRLAENKPTFLSEEFRSLSRRLEEKYACYTLQLLPGRLFQRAPKFASLPYPLSGPIARLQREYHRTSEFYQEATFDFHKDKDHRYLDVLPEIQVANFWYLQRELTLKGHQCVNVLWRRARGEAVEPTAVDDIIGHLGSNYSGRLSRRALELVHNLRLGPLIPVGEHIERSRQPKL